MHQPDPVDNLDPHAIVIPPDPIVLRLYIAGEGPNSERARTNIQQVCDTYWPGQYQLEIVDVLDTPLRALSDGVLVTPTLIKLSPAPRCQLVGDLSAHAQVLLALGIPAQKVC